MPNTPRLNLPYPLAEDPPDGPAQIGALASQLDSLTASDEQGTLAARPAAGTRGRYYYATDSGQLFRDTGTTWVATGAVPVVSSLPGSPANGQEIYYDLGTIRWHLRYSSGLGKWDFLGGPPLTAEVATGQTTTSTTYGVLATNGPELALPLPGDYLVAAGFRGSNTVAGSWGNYMSYEFGAGTAADADMVALGGTTAGVAMGHAYRERLKTGLTAVVVAARYKVSGGTGTFLDRWMKITPYRLG